jgi:hypothetical protein
MASSERRVPPMRQLIVFFAVFLALVAVSVSAAEVREIELQDGTILAGEIISLSGGIYTVRSESLGTITVEESKIRSIRTRSRPGKAGESYGGTYSAEQVGSLLVKMMSNQEIMDLIHSLQNDPEFKKILADPEVMKAVNAGDIAALTANPQFMKLLNNSTVQEIERKAKPN